MNTKQDKSDHWLVRPASIRLMWWVGCVLLALTVIVQLVIPVKGYFGVDGWLAFGAIFGFASCLLMVLFAKALGWLLKRGEGYYQRGSDDNA